VDDDQTTIDLRVPPKVIPAERVQGTYANSIQQLSTGNETILDFSAVLPSFYEVNSEGQLEGIQLANEVVAGIVVPHRVFVEFVRSVVRNNPEAFNDGDNGDRL
jgi:hypothetical protein